MTYVVLEVKCKPLHPFREIWIAELSGVGFESFVETKTGLKGYISEKRFQRERITQIEKKYPNTAVIECRLVEEKNWNARWEESFLPVFVEDKLVIKAPFHHQPFHCPLQLVIQPHMSFGTGHHPTTWLMARQLFDIELNDKKVLDVGTGTGVLSILSEKLGAAAISALDIDENACRNAKKNSRLNGCCRIDVCVGDVHEVTQKRVDVILANLSKNTLTNDFSAYASCLKSEGNLLISGFLTEDTTDLKREAIAHGFVFEEENKREEWVLIQFYKSSQKTKNR